MARKIEAAFEALKNAGNRLIKQICLKQLTGILNLDSSVKKIRLPTEKNDLQKEIKDKDEDKKTTNLPDWDKVVYDIVCGNGQTSGGQAMLEENPHSAWTRTCTLTMGIAVVV